MAPILAVDFGGTNIRVARFESEQPPFQAHIKTPTEASAGPQAVIQRLEDAIASLLPEDRSDMRIGIGAPGPLDPHSGTILNAPNLPGWKDIPLRRMIEDEFNLPVSVGNDANVAALGEWKFGAGRGTHDMVYLTVSTGIGGGVIAGDQLLLGLHGLAAELGHVTVDPQGPRCSCGKIGHIEAFASGPAIARRAVALLEEGAESSLASKYADQGSLDAGMVGAAALAGDSLAVGIIQKTGDILGAYLANLAHIFNPECFVIGGGVSQIGDLLFKSIESALHAHVMDPSYLDGLQVFPAKLGDDAGLIGAMALAASEKE